MQNTFNSQCHFSKYLIKYFDPKNIYETISMISVYFVNKSIQELPDTMLNSDCYSVLQLHEVKGGR